MLGYINSFFWWLAVLLPLLSSEHGAAFAGGIGEQKKPSGFPLLLDQFPWNSSDLGWFGDVIWVSKTGMFWKHFHTGNEPNLKVSRSLASRCEATEEAGSHSRQAKPETTELPNVTSFRWWSMEINGGQWIGLREHRQESLILLIFHGKINGFLIFPSSNSVKGKAWLCEVAFILAFCMQYGPVMRRMSPSGQASRTMMCHSGSQSDFCSICSSHLQSIKGSKGSETRDSACRIWDNSTWGGKSPEIGALSKASIHRIH